MKRYIEKEINNGVITNVITTYKRQINISLSAKHILHQGFMNHAQKNIYICCSTSEQKVLKI